MDEKHSNGAKMREALGDTLDALKSLSKSHGTDLPEDVRALLGRMAFTVNAAIAAPPRNCDRLPNRAAAIEAYQKDTGLNKHPAVLWTAAQIYAFIDWLFATKKGENDAIK